MSEDAEASVVARPEVIGAGHNAYLEAAWAVRRFGLVVGIAGLVWLVALRSVSSWCGRLVGGGDMVGCGRLVGGVDEVWSLRRIGAMVVNESSIWLRMRCHMQPYGRRRGERQNAWYLPACGILEPKVLLQTFHLVAGFGGVV